MGKTCYFERSEDIAAINRITPVMDFTIGLEISVCSNAVDAAYALMLDRPDLFCGTAKRWGKIALKHIGHHMTAIRGLMENKAFWDDYIESVIDIAMADVEEFRRKLYDVIVQKTENNALLYSYIEVAAALMRMTADHWSIVTGKRFSLRERQYKRDFAEFNIADARDAWTNMCDLIYHIDTETDLNTPETKEAFYKIYDKFVSEEYAKACVDIAKGGHGKFKHKIRLNYR